MAAVATRDGAARLELVDLGATAGGRAVLAGVTLDIAVGEIVAIVGPNGAGKTTLLECVAGLRRATGAVRFADRPLRTFAERARVTSYMPDEIVPPHETTVQRALGIDPASPVAAALDVGALLAARGDRLSRGEHKRCQLCAAFAVDRAVTLLDEPLAAFDPRQLRALIPVIRELAARRAVVITVHQMRSAELIADRIVLLAGGRIVAVGTVAELRARAGLDAAPFDDVFLALLDEVPA